MLTLYQIHMKESESLICQRQISRMPNHPNEYDLSHTTQVNCYTIQYNVLFGEVGHRPITHSMYVNNYSNAKYTGTMYIIWSTDWLKGPSDKTIVSTCH